MNIVIRPNFTVFCSTKKIHYNNKNKITETFDNNALIKRTESDEFDRFIDTKYFDKNGAISEHQHFEYNPDGYVETFKNKESEYTRKVKTFIENSLKYRIEEYVSNNAKANYVHESISSLSGKLLRFICNGQTVLDLIKKA